MVRLQQPVQPGQLRSKQSVPQCYSTKPIRTQVIIFVFIYIYIDNCFYSFRNDYERQKELK